MKKITLGAIFADGEKILKQHWKSYLLLWLVWVVPIHVVLFFLPYESIGVLLHTSLEVVTSRTQEILTAIFSSFFLVGLIRLVGNSYHVQTMNASMVLKESMYFWPNFALTSVLMGIYLGFLMFLLVIPGIVAGVFWMFAGQAAILGAVSGWSAMKYSYHVIRGRVWQTLLYNILMILALVALVAIPSFLIALIPGLQMVAVDLILSLISILFVGVLYVWQTVMYLFYEEAYLELPDQEEIN